MVNVFRADDALATLRSMNDRITAERQRLRAELDDARHDDRDADLTAEARDRVRGERLEAVRERSRQRVARMLAEVDRARDVLLEYTAGAGERSPDDVAAIERERDAWRRLEPLLGRQSWESVLERLTVDEARALLAELPRWADRRAAEAEPGPGGVRPMVDVAPVLRMVRERLAGLLPGREGERLRMALEAGSLEAQARARLESVHAVAEGGGVRGLQAALAGRAAGQVAGPLGAPVGASSGT